ncbi:Streptomycin 3''-adenylyltransferase [Saezia sanguinis]|uniref:Aminoglycoside (3'') (9) adenylyltransferase n=1 Tax=Saezia sanguinis TaxID=1965230 RepID=A0A433SAL8_9BURK|nr:aminoglycoside adenylyltransferase family protein [Saezia sanguinis]RUS65781.1 Streptomycin 3''-adenylyltransferase [Saezia sanguinis]
MAHMLLSPEAQQALHIIQQQLAESLLAVCLHGSAAAGGLRPHSDVDILAIVSQPMSAAARQSLAAELMQVSGRSPSDLNNPNGRRPLEVIVFLSTDLAALPYPARCEFMYGEWLRAQYEAGDMPQPVSDPELTLILAQARQQAKGLLGPDMDELLPVVHPSDIRRAIKDAVPALMQGLQGDERNVLLTLARMWQTLATGGFVSKDEAANWAVPRLPAPQARVLLQARDAYLNGDHTDWISDHTAIQQTADALYNGVMSN